MKLDRAKSSRLNLIGDRVDCNQIKKQEAMRQKEMGAFGGGKQVFARDNKPARLLSPTAQAKLKQVKEQQQDKFVSYMGSR